MVFYRERVPDREFTQGLERKRDAASAPEAGAMSMPDDDYAATGMGGRTDHGVVRVDVDLDPRPIASARIRYEFRPQLVKLGVIPRDRAPLERREKARGFERYCPEPD